MASYFQFLALTRNTTLTFSDLVTSRDSPIVFLRLGAGNQRIGLRQLARSYQLPDTSLCALGDRQKAPRLPPLCLTSSEVQSKFQRRKSTVQIVVVTCCIDS
jgi:hypothetical protein